MKTAATLTESAATNMVIAGASEYDKGLATLITIASFGRMRAASGASVEAKIISIADSSGAEQKFLQLNEAGMSKIDAIAERLGATVDREASVLRCPKYSFNILVFWSIIKNSTIL